MSIIVRYKKKERKDTIQIKPRKVSRCQNFALTHREYATQCNGVGVYVYVYVSLRDEVAGVTKSQDLEKSIIFFFGFLRDC